MKKFPKENWYKAVISLASVIIASSVAYYFVIYLPYRDKRVDSQQSAKIDQDNAQKCAEAGQKYFDANFSEYKNSGFKVILDGPNFHFNKKLGACLLEYKLQTFNQSYLDNPSGDYIGSNYIINLLSGNQVFTTYSWTKGKFSSDFDSSEFQRFEKQEVELMQN